jgi:putative addiction module component (TIGR02574 family)
MSELAEKLLSQALALSPNERARLAAELIASVDGEPDADAQAAWAAEIDRRIRAADASGARGDDWKTVEARVAAHIRR